MNDNASFEQFFTTHTAQIDIVNFVFNLLMAAGLAFLLSRVYIHYGTSLSNRRQFARNFVLIATATMIIITVVKSSLALSLGLVGALSIVRFRSAIKEPEELSYLFLLISVGLGMGANQKLITLVSFCVVIGIIVALSYLYRTENNQNMYLSVSLDDTESQGLSPVIDILKQNCEQVKLKRFDEANARVEGTFIVEFRDFEQLEESRRSIRALNDSASITFIDNKVVV